MTGGTLNFSMDQLRELDTLISNLDSWIRSVDYNFIESNHGPRQAVAAHSFRFRKTVD